MPPTGNKRRPRSGAPERPDLKEKAERMHAEIFGREPETPAPVKTGPNLLRSLSGITIAALCYVVSRLLDNEYLLIFAMSLALGTLLMILIRLFSRRRR